MIVIPLIALALIKLSRLAALSSDAPKIYAHCVSGSDYAFRIHGHTNVPGIWK